MSASPEDFTLLQKVMGAAVAIVTPIYGAYKVIETKLDKKANASDLKDTNERFAKHIERLYENAEKDRATTRNLCSDITDKLTDRMDKQHQHIVDLIVKRES